MAVTVPEVPVETYGLQGWSKDVWFDRLAQCLQAIVGEIQYLERSP